MFAHALRVALVLTSLSVTCSLPAGDLDPPGSPEPTVNLAEPHIPIRSLPFTILEPGSYVLVNDLIGGAPTGITISTSHVTLDLNGFSLVGDGTSINADGIAVGGGPTLTDITIQNGRIRNWGAGGVDVDFLVTGVRLHSLTLESNALEGILVREGHCMITDCMVIDNGTAGSFSGINANGSLIRGCLATGNGRAGIFAYGGSVIDCTALQNGREGIHAAMATVSSCTANGNQDDGFQIRDGSTATDCTASSNQGDGFTLEWGSTIRGCTAFRNSDDGIDVDSDCFVVGNHCTESTGGAAAGILVRGDNNCIDGNVVLNQATGINLIGSDNLVIRNRARGNTAANYIDNGTNNSVAQRLFGGVNFSSTDPWANFEH